MSLAMAVILVCGLLIAMPYILKALGFVLGFLLGCLPLLFNPAVIFIGVCVAAVLWGAK